MITDSTWCILCKTRIYLTQPTQPKITVSDVSALIVILGNVVSGFNLDGRGSQ